MNINVKRFCDIQQIGEHATHAIAQFSSLSALLLRLAWNGHAALWRLAEKLENCTLARVQLRNLGLSKGSK